jgi:hypothetical protein
MRPIIVEGPDGAGKSTLVKDLGLWLKRETFHTGGATGTLEELDAKFAEIAWLTMISPGVILDRCPYISDHIYKEALGIPLLRDKANLRVRLAVLNPIIIYCCLQDKARMLMNISSEHKPHKSPEYLEGVKNLHPRIVENYETEMATLQALNFTVFRFDWTRDYFNQLVGDIVCAG